MGFFARGIETAPRAAIETHQFARLRSLLERSSLDNPFYRTKFRAAGLGSLQDVIEIARSPDRFRQLPTSGKQELLDDQAAHPPHGTNVLSPSPPFVRQHQTSGTTGTPLKVWETRQSWEWMTTLWLYQLLALDITPVDTIFMAFNFGHSLGLWNVLDAGMQLGALTLTGGGLTSLQRVDSIVHNRATVLVCTPSYALRLAEVAADNRIDIRRSAVGTIIVGGEPGASVAGTRDRIERLWGARLYDSPGLTEVGHIGLACPHQGVHLVESEFYVEMLDPETQRPVGPGEAGEIVVTNFGRPATPVIRYRTRDVARPVYDMCPCGRTFMRLEGGIIGRSDDMIVVRGVNVFPSLVEAIIRECGDVSEYSVEIVGTQDMYSLRIKIELDADCTGGPETIRRRIEDTFHRRLYLKTDVEVVPAGALPRSGAKRSRFVRVEADKPSLK
ncbi:MAG: hypothetical protein A3H97_04830 [Acidobacteria bacterium RIFCSPLOWO2_02_FULL_65_29]|nr:MAG: hypothetical protein A3H97_04830 [Acidobacteria bacterium RIFCSPLOWO2_02_FULL_65_29]